MIADILLYIAIAIGVCALLGYVFALASPDKWFDWVHKKGQGKWWYPSQDERDARDIEAEDAALEAVFDSQLREHPLPWRVERDWAFEVIASDGAIIAKCPTRDGADAIISLAQERHAERQRRAA